MEAYVGKLYRGHRGRNTSLCLFLGYLNTRLEGQASSPTLFHLTARADANSLLAIPALLPHGTIPVRKKELDPHLQAICVEFFCCFADRLISQ